MNISFNDSLQVTEAIINFDKNEFVANTNSSYKEPWTEYDELPSYGTRYNYYRLNIYNDYYVISKFTDVSFIDNGVIHKQYSDLIVFTNEDYMYSDKYKNSLKLFRANDIMGNTIYMLVTSNSDIATYDKKLSYSLDMSNIEVIKHIDIITQPHVFAYNNYWPVIFPRKMRLYNYGYTSKDIDTTNHVSNYDFSDYKLCAINICKTIPEYLYIKNVNSSNRYTLCDFDYKDVIVFDLNNRSKKVYMYELITEMHDKYYILTQNNSISSWEFWQMLDYYDIDNFSYLREIEFHNRSSLVICDDVQHNNLYTVFNIDNKKRK